MDIKLISENDLNWIQENFRFVWKKISRRSIRPIYFYFIIGLGCMFYGSSLDYTFKFRNSGSGFVAYDLNILLTIGISLVIVGSVNLSSLWKYRSHYFNKMDILISRTKIFTCEIDINNFKFRYSDNELMLEANWNRISHYLITPRSIILFLDNSSEAFIAIPCIQLTESEFKDLTNFLALKCSLFNG